MKYRVFDTEAEALAAEAQIANDMGYSKIGTNAATGLPDTTAQATATNYADIPVEWRT
jgi:hypothetical protein